jgi:putative FmdB family regulatory protein
MVLNDYQCGDCGTVSEQWDKRGEVANHTCPHCGSTSLSKQISPGHLGYTSMAANGESSSDSMGTAIDKWAKMREQKQRIERRNLERHGTYE